MGIFKRGTAVAAKKITAWARYVDDDVQRVDLTVVTTDGEKAILELTLDQVRALIPELVSSYQACRPDLLDNKAAQRIAGFFGMR